MRPRSSPRIPVQSLGDIGTATLDAGTIEVSLLNISDGGMALLSDARLGDIDDSLVIELDAPYSDELICLPCSLRYVIGEQHAALRAQPRWLSGARFERLPVHGRRFVEWCLEQHQERQAQPPCTPLSVD